MIKHSFTALLLAFLLIAAACGESERASGGYVPVPKRYGYPRIELPDSSFHTADPNLPFSLQTNTAANVDVDRSDEQITWVNVFYPAVNARIHYTFTSLPSPDRLADVIDNRLERIGLNAGSADVEELTFTSPAGFENHVFTARGVTTPVQFLSTDGHSTVISGTAWLRDANNAAADSLAPVVDMLRRDIVHSLKTLQK